MRNQVLNTEFPAVRKMAGIARSSCKTEGIAPLNSRKNLPGSGADRKRGVCHMEKTTLWIRLCNLKRSENARVFHGDAGAKPIATYPSPCDSLRQLPPQDANNRKLAATSHPRDAMRIWLMVFDGCKKGQLDGAYPMVGEEIARWAWICLCALIVPQISSKFLYSARC